MAKILELVGSPGVGKTTLFRAIETKWSKSDNWTPAQYFYPTKEVVTKKSGLFLIDIVKRFKNRHGKVDTGAMEEAGRRFIQLYPEYIEACWNNVNWIQKKNLSGLDLRFQKITYLSKVIKKIQILREHPSDKIAIVDEGLIHMINSVMYKREAAGEEIAEIKHFLELMPLPDGMVYITTGIRENVRRLRERKKVIPMHKTLNNEELENIISHDHGKRAIINTMVKSKNVPFLHIDSTNPVKENVSKIISFAQSLK